MSLSFASLTWLQPVWLIASACLLMLAAVWRFPGLKDHWQRVLSDNVLAYLGGRKRQWRRWDLLLLMAAIVCMALARPAVRQSSDDTWRHSIGWVVVADVSRSMTLNDTVPSRLSAAREALLALSRAAGARPIAMILFAGDAFLVAPPAFDRSHFNEHAALLEYGVVPNEGSNLARALSLASSVIEESGYIRARVFVVGDSGGSNQSSEAAARHLASSGHRTDVILFGDDAGDNANADDPDSTLVDLVAGKALATAGGGLLIHGNKFGVLDYKSLKLASDTDASTVSALESLVWRNQSHWLLLLLLPLMLYWFRQHQGDTA